MKSAGAVILPVDFPCQLKNIFLIANQYKGITIHSMCPF